MRTWPWLIAACLLLALFPGRLALTDPDEARYAQTSREMLRGRDYVVPRFDGEPRLAKPPLIHWMQAAVYAVAGESETAARAPSVAAGLATVLLVAWWARRRVGPDAAGPAAAILATTPIFFVCARLAITDMLLAFGVTAALLCWREAVAAQTRAEGAAGAARRWWSWGAAAAIGMSALAKGPVGPALAGAIIMATRLATWLESRLPSWVAAHRGGRGAGAAEARRLITLRGMALGAAGVALVAGPWAVLLAARIGAGGLIELLRRETVQRTLYGLDHPRPSYYYLATWWVTFFPWSLAAAFALWRWIRESRTGGAGADDPETFFLLCWLGGALLFFSLPADKNDAYLLPAAPAAALLAARWLPRRLSLAGGAAMAALLVAGLLFGAAPLSRDRSLKELTAPLALSTRPGTELISYRMYRPSLVFYANHPARWVASGAELRRLLPAIPATTPVILVMTDERLASLRANQGPLLEGFRIMSEQPGYVALSRGE